VAEGILLAPGEFLPRERKPPAQVTYCAIKTRFGTFAGTDEGVFRLVAGQWVIERSECELPVSRPNGLAYVAGRYVTGGLGGLWIGAPGHWTQAAPDSIRQVVTEGESVWIVHGDGALDKILPGSDRIYPDALSGQVKRPWTSCMRTAGSKVLLGGAGGWIERGDVAAEHYPTELDGQVVTAISSVGASVWVGTQDSGLIRFGGGAPKVWNPGNGLSDTWVTDLCHTPEGMFVATSHAGLFRIRGDSVERRDGPTQRVTKLAMWGNRLVVGGMDGAWVYTDGLWAPLDTNREETTAIEAIHGKLAVCTAAGIFFFSDTPA